MRRLTFSLALSLLALVCALAPSRAFASNVVVSDSGTFASGVPNTTESAPGETWSFSFSVNSNPAVSNVVLGQNFDTSFSNFTYTLNGSPVATSPTELTWYSTPLGGLIDLTFADGVLSIYGNQAYSGSEASPTILPGAYPVDNTQSFFQDNYFNSGAIYASPLTISPEPSTFLLLGSGLFAIFGLAAFRRA
jgi:hypothetical protein